MPTVAGVIHSIRKRINKTYRNRASTMKKRVEEATARRTVAAAKAAEADKKEMKEYIAMLIARSELQIQSELAKAKIPTHTPRGGRRSTRRNRH